ncbi:MAG: ankyrin repeat domain-containing protein [Candidatus Omnitrophica bacterium]|nr:ankyrin repeat domain-containing protein [Candidatus Omnitrophota bacterium]
MMQALTSMRMGIHQGTVLHAAVVAGRRKIVEFLIDDGADLDAQTAACHSPCA